MNRALLRSTSFVRAAKKYAKKYPNRSNDLLNVLELLSQDIFHPQLKTHKLKGDKEGSWACSVDFDLRIIFSLVEHEGTEAILLESIGTHNEVY